MNKPDFEEWARNVVEYNDNPENDWSAVCVALEQSFEQGYQLGLNKGWAHELDKAIIETDVENIFGPSPWEECDHNWCADDVSVYCSKCLEE